MRPHIFPYIIFLVLISLFQKVAVANGEVDYPDPARWEPHIERFEAADREAMPPAGAIVFAGSSSIAWWHDRHRSLEEDMAPLTVIGRGFGGSCTSDVLHYADRIIVPYEPQGVVIYVGENDLAMGISVEKASRTFRRLVAHLRAELPDTRLYLLSAKPSVSRESLWPTFREFNAGLEAIARADALVTYVDISPPMLDEDGRPRPDVFVDDMLHMNREGYLLWREILRPILLEAHPVAGEKGEGEQPQELPDDS